MFKMPDEPIQYCHNCDKVLTKDESGLCDICEPDHYICTECGGCYHTINSIIVDDSYYCKGCIDVLKKEGKL